MIQKENETFWTEWYGLIFTVKFEVWHYLLVQNQYVSNRLLSQLRYIQEDKEDNIRRNL